MVFRCDLYPALTIAQATAAEEQPRQAVNETNRRALPHADPSRQQQSSLLQKVPLDCRLLIWEYVLRPSQTRIERWRPDNKPVFLTADACDADCFPYRVITAGCDKREKPLNLLLACRQLYAHPEAVRQTSLKLMLMAHFSYIEGLSLLYETRFVFEMPLDLYSFQACVSPEGLSSVKSLIIALGQIDCPGHGPFLSHLNDNTDYTNPGGSLEAWENAIGGLKRMTGLQELHIWLGHLHVQNPELERRPWKQHEENDILEQSHQKLFDLFGTVDMPRFTIHLTWKPEDLLSHRKWPFNIELHTKDEMMHVLDYELPVKTEPDIFDWD
jgi:hypothetical protein